MAAQQLCIKEKVFLLAASAVDKLGCMCVLLGMELDPKRMLLPQLQYIVSKTKEVLIVY